MTPTNSETVNTTKIISFTLCSLFMIFFALFNSGYFPIVILLFFSLLVSTFYYFNILSGMHFADLIKKESAKKTIKREQRVKEIILVVLTVSLFVGVIFA